MKQGKLCLPMQMRCLAIYELGQSPLHLAASNCQHVSLDVAAFGQFSMLTRAKSKHQILQEIWINTD